MAANVSHGRGGAGNLGPDDTPYTDGEIVREGPTGDQGDGPYSAGRGGAGNIEHSSKAVGSTPHDHEVVPEVATRPSNEEPHHVGRGGAGNEARPTEKKHSFIDKLKSIFK
ncbi:hypothetical protein B0A52_00994 [Exophiala mesophila]|uniref:Uncharacterized protein n=1 Tax=Exophiala mesophila TaxID=212818 RepID=A0A438NIT3_EXOME|nr:hypothetical protein B0A52_00994 [Exophiala mesophila]